MLPSLAMFLDTDASTWFNCVVRGDNEPISIGKGSNIQEGSIIHTDPGFKCIIGDNVTVGIWLCFMDVKLAMARLLASIQSFKWAKKTV